MDGRKKASARIFWSAFSLSKHYYFNVIKHQQQKQQQSKKNSNWITLNDPKLICSFALCRVSERW